jgi:hypothetical protein
VRNLGMRRRRREPKPGHCDGQQPNFERSLRATEPIAGLAANLRFDHLSQFTGRPSLQEALGKQTGAGFPDFVAERLRCGDAGGTA